MNPITAVFAKEIKDSRGEPTIEVSLSTNQHTARAAVPAGESAGSHEAVKLPAAAALKIVETIVAPALVGQLAETKIVDDILLRLDGTPNKSKLGGNVAIGVSFAAARLTALEKNLPLWRLISEANNTKPSCPALFMNLINGGVHGNGNFHLPFQEYMLVLATADPRRAYETGVNIFAKLGEMVRAAYGECPLGDEGGYSPPVATIEEPFQLLEQARANAAETFLAIDAAASEFYRDGRYWLLNKTYTCADLLSLYKDLIKKFPLRSIEDPFFEDAAAEFKQLNDDLPEQILIVGDDLTVTNPRRMENFVKNKTVNAVIIKPNQVGTLTETYAAVKLARAAGWKCIVSHRSGDTLDDFIADLAVGLGAYGLKAGSPLPPERKAKYNRLIEIYETEMLG